MKFGKIRSIKHTFGKISHVAKKGLNKLEKGLKPTSQILNLVSKAGIPMVSQYAGVASKGLNKLDKKLK